VDDRELEAIEARAAAANPGPWTTVLPSIELGYTDGHTLVDGEGCHFGELAPAEDDPPGGHRNSNAAFAAAARTDVPALVAALRRERARCAELRAACVALAAARAASLAATEAWRVGEAGMDAVSAAYDQFVAATEALVRIGKEARGRGITSEWLAETARERPALDADVPHACQPAREQDDG
jgi:hypothetical protein